MGTSAPLPVAPQPGLPTQELPSCSFEICNKQAPEKVCRATFNITYLNINLSKVFNIRSLLISQITFEAQCDGVVD